MRRFKKARDIKVGVIGYGGAFNMGRTHMNEMKKAGMTPVAVAELDKERLKVAEEDFPGIETYTSVTTMLKKSDVNVITIITPHNTHAKLGLQCLKSGRHVICEKPLAITTAECDAMIAEARKQKLVLSTYHNRHWDGCILEAVNIIKNKGMIGDVVRGEAHVGGWNQPRDWWRASRSISGGILYDWGVHLLEYCLQIIDSDIVEVTGLAKRGVWDAKSKWKKDTIESEGFAVVRFKSGAWLTLHMSNIDMNPKRGMVEFTGTKGTYIMEGGSYEIITKKKQQTVVTKGKNRGSEWHRFYQNIADHLTKGEKLIITPEWSRRPIHIIDLANQSAKQGRALKAKYK